ncbi:MAG: hypothetical protein JOZ63_12410 [Planctomycetaceae bacterium]|nr:hypothetical protein [Planctomycetaceae bacterium]
MTSDEIPLFNVGAGGPHSIGPFLGDATVHVGELAVREGIAVAAVRGEFLDVEGIPGPGSFLEILLELFEIVKDTAFGSASHPVKPVLDDDRAPLQAFADCLHPRWTQVAPAVDRPSVLFGSHRHE